MRKMLAVLVVLGGLVVAWAAPASAVVTSYTNRVGVTCNGHALTVWGTFNSDSSTGKHRGARGGFNASDATQLYGKVSVYSYGASGVTTASIGQTTSGSAYSTGSWQASAATVQVVPYYWTGGQLKACANGYGYVVQD